LGTTHRQQAIEGIIGAILVLLDVHPKLQQTIGRPTKKADTLPMDTPNTTLL
jgi:hypothetical protein